jgi:hypothetical protein
VEVRNFVALLGEVFSILHGGSYLMLSFWFKPDVACVACHSILVPVVMRLFFPCVILKLFQGPGNAVCAVAQVGEQDMAN